MTLVAALLILRRESGHGSDADRSAWQPPAQTFLTPPVGVKPAPGWRLTVADLGLPPDSRIVTDERPRESTPFIGSLGDTAYFLASTPAARAANWWLVGVDTRQGRPTFAPVALDTGEAAPECIVNAPAAVLCVRDGGDSRNTVEGAIAWVVDTMRGTVSYVGPTDLRTYPDELTVHAIGPYGVAETQHQGVHGIGARAEPTWFVPGDGKADQLYARVGDVTPSSLLTQNDSRGGREATIVFSAIDGAVVSSGTGDIRSAQVYPGGFAVDVAVGEVDDQVQFFDESGTRVGDVSLKAGLTSHTSDLPVVQTPQGWAVYSPRGTLLLDVTGNAPGHTRLIGTTFYAQDPDSSNTVWRQYDLRTGSEGKSCDYKLDSDFLGSDGKVGVFEKGNPNVGLVTEARDLATCDSLWTIASPAGSFRDVWRVTTTLVQLSDDGTELMSLVPSG
jgi:hypothetical protein